MKQQQHTNKKYTLRRDIYIYIYIRVKIKCFWVTYGGVSSNENGNYFEKVEPTIHDEYPDNENA